MGSSKLALTRVDLVERLQESAGLPKPDASRLIEEVIALIKAAALSHDGLKVAGFGTFTVRYKKAREGRNPKTQVVVPIAKRWVFVFRASSLLRSRLRGALVVTRVGP